MPLGQWAVVALRIAMFPRGIDGLFLRENAIDLVALVQRGTPEEAWAQRTLPASQCVPYELSSDLGPYPATEDLLLRSDVHRALSKHRVSELLLSAACTRGIHAWATQHGVRLWMVDYEEQRRLEDKIWFDRFLRRHRIPTPDGAALKLGGRVAFPFRGAAVVQARDSMGGEGTYFVDGAHAAHELVRSRSLHANRRYLVRRFVDGVPYGITILVAPGRISLSAIRRQCYYGVADAGARAATTPVFAGVQWVPSRTISARLRQRIDRVLLRLGDLLYRRRTFGLANVDFVVDRDERPYILECNPRMSAATPQLFHVPELLSGGGAGASFVAGFLGRRVFSRPPLRHGLPDTSYDGATLDIVSHGGGAVRRAFKTGVYRVGPARVRYVTPDVRRLGASDELCFVSFARPGQVSKPADTLGEVVSQFPLYDASGALTLRGSQVSSFFRVTDDRQRPRS